LSIDLAGSLSRSDAAHELDFKRTKQSSAGKIDVVVSNAAIVEQVPLRR